MLDRWIRTQRIGYAAHVVNSLPSSEHKTIGRVLTILADELLSASPQFLRQIPPVSWRLLLAIKPGRLNSTQLARFYSECAEYLTQLETPERDNMASPVRRAQILAHHILYGNVRSIQLFSLARSLHIQICPVPETVVAEPLRTIRSSQSTTSRKVAAIEPLHRALVKEQDEKRLWGHVENILYHHILSWPLVISCKDPYGKAIGIPIAIDVTFDYAGSSNEPDIRPTDYDTGLIDISEWKDSLRTAVEAAKKLWRIKHGNYGMFRKGVEKASVVFDLGFIQKIVRGFPIRFKFKQRSMEAYLSQVILRRLLGERGFTSSMVTGSVGARRKDEENQLDYEFMWPSGVPNKLQYVFGTQYFERIVLPKLDKHDPNYRKYKELEQFLEGNKELQSAEVNYAKRLQHVADCVQHTGWRQYKYIRCPDVAWALHSQDGELPALDTAEVKKCLRSLEHNDSAVLELKGVKAADLAAALWYINTEFRRKVFLFKTCPPMISWAFVRAIPQEQDARFWYVIWQLIGAPMEDFEAFHNSTTPQRAAPHFIRAMNMFSPADSHPNYRAPDILVIVGAEHLEDSLSTISNALSCLGF
jgi:hypothetical protein